MASKNIFDPQCITYSQMNLIFNSRIIWRRLTTWIRAYIIGRYTGVGTEEDLFGRLYLEPVEFGRQLQIVFGRIVAQDYTNLLREYVIALRDLISGQLEGNNEEVEDNVNRLYQNVDKRAAFLASINPYFNEAEWRDLMRTHLQYILEQTASFSTGDYSNDIETFDSLTELSNRMGDLFAQGLYDYVTTGRQNAAGPAPRDGQQCLTYEQVDQIYGIRMFWFELFSWVRAYMLSRYLELGNADEVFARLRQVPLEYVNGLRRFFGEHPGADELEVELNTYLDLISALITAQMAGDSDEVSRIIQLLNQNADERAASVSTINPFWTEEEWKVRLHNNLRYTLAESETFLNGDFSRNLDIFTTLLDVAESSSGYFAQGLYQYIVYNRQQETDSETERLRLSGFWYYTLPR